MIYIFICIRAGKTKEESRKRVRGGIEGRVNFIFRVTLKNKNNNNNKKKKMNLLATIKTEFCFLFVPCVPHPFLLSQKR